MLSYILYRIGQFIALSLPLKFAYRLAVSVSDAHYIFARKDRIAVRDNLRAIFPQKSDREICRIRFKMYRNFAKCLVDFLRFSKIDKDYITELVKIDNSQYIEEALKKGKGAVLLSAHIGNWELGAIRLALSGYHLWVVALSHKERKVNDFFIQQRESKGVRVIALGKAVRQCLMALKINELVALVGDRDFGENGAVIDFFGRPSHFPKGPAAFAVKTGAPILPGFMVRNQDDSFTLKIEKPVEFNTSGDNESDIINLISRYKVIFEEYIRRYPEQWYMFRRFWIE